MKYSLLIGILLFACSLIHSQDDVHTSKYALSFGISDNFRLDRFNMDIAVKKIIDESHQLRLFLSPRILVGNDEESVDEPTQKREIDRTSISLGVGADYLWTILSDNDISMFSGTGLIITYGTDNETINSSSPENSIIKDERDITQISTGIRGTLGVEWRVSEKIGIHSEYLLTASYNWRNQERTSFRTDQQATATVKSTNFYLNSGVLFGLSVYL